MKSKHKIVSVSLLALLEFLILLFGALYLFQYHPHIFYQQKPAALVIDIEGEVISSRFYGVFEQRNQERSNATSSLNVIRMLEHFSADDSIKAFILEINAFGGQTAGQEEIARYIQKMDKPVVAVMKDFALDSGYYVAASTDKIYAHDSSKIGKMGNTFVYVDRNRNGRYQVCNITSSRYKSIMAEDCPGFDPSLFEKLKYHVGASHDIIVSHIAVMRGLPTYDIGALSNEVILNGQQALAFDLIDEIGDTSDALAWLEEETGTDLAVLYLRDMLPSRQNER